MLSGVYSWPNPHSLRLRSHQGPDTHIRVQQLASVLHDVRLVLELLEEHLVIT